MNVIIVNHGKQFGNDNWYTFYCPYCNRQLVRANSEDECFDCGKPVKWKSD